MAEIAFLSVDPDHESSNFDDSTDCEELEKNQIQVPKMEEIEHHINSYENRPGTAVFEICGDTVNPFKKVTAEDFQILKVIGKGGYGTVFLVNKTSRGTDKNKLYAMKVLKKAKLILNEKTAVHTVSERNILQTLKHPFLVRLHYAFQNRSNLYIVLEYCPGGELFNYLERECFLTEDDACFYMAEISLAIGHLHSLGIIYRDLKPENVLLGKDGHVKLTDFGLSKEGVRTTNTFCGTIEYMAPEIIRCEGHGKAVDWWSLGTLLFDMLSGGPPFGHDESKTKTAERILNSSIKFPPSFSTEVIHFIRDLLKKDPEERLGSENDVEEIKAHFFFVRRHINWDDVYNLKMKPPYIPELSSESDVSMFDSSFTLMKPVVSPETPDEAVPSDLFEGFSFVASSVFEPHRAVVPDLSRFRSIQKVGATHKPEASPQNPGHPASEHPTTPDTMITPSSFVCGVDLSDFATISSAVQLGSGGASSRPLPKVCEDEDEGDIHGAMSIRANGGGRSFHYPCAQEPLNVTGANEPTSHANPSATTTSHTVCKHNQLGAVGSRSSHLHNLLITHPSGSASNLSNSSSTAALANAHSPCPSTTSSVHSKSHDHSDSEHEVLSGNREKAPKCSIM